MLDQWMKVTAIGAAMVVIISAIIAPSIGGIIWLSRLDFDVNSLQTDVSQLQSDVGQLQTDVSQLQSDVGQLQTDVSQLQTDVAQLRSDVEQLQQGQQTIIEILRTLVDDGAEIRTNLTEHTHGPDGRAQFSLLEDR